MQIQIQHCMKYILIIMISLGCARKASPSPVATSATDTQAVWQYQPQRCTKWETPDAGGGSQPAIDYLVVYEDMTQT